MLTFTWWEWCGLCLCLKPAELAHSVLFCSWRLSLSSRSYQLYLILKILPIIPAFSLCSSGLISVLLVFSTIYIFLKTFLSFSSRDGLFLLLYGSCFIAAGRGWLVGGVCCVLPCGAGIRCYEFVSYVFFNCFCSFLFISFLL